MHSPPVPAGRPCLPALGCLAPGALARWSRPCCFLSRPPPQVTQYLLDQSSVMDEESLYESSLRIEPKLPT